MDLGKRIEGWCDAKEMDFAELAEKVGVTVAAVYQWVGSGESRTNPSASNLPKIAKAFGVSLSEFFGPIPKKAKAS
ncbi:MAG: helix-turn-helix domain-containing protein [Kofleriaceae bacterium]